MKKTSKKTPYKGVVSAFLLLVVALIASVSALFAWFSDRSKAVIGGTDFTVVGANVTLGDIDLTRTLGAQTQTLHYMRDGNAYYLSRNGAAVVENGAKIPLAIDALAQDEEVALAIKVKADKELKNYSITLSGLSGDTLAQEGGINRNTLGAFCYYNKEESGWSWFLEYKTDGSETAPKQITVETGSFSDADRDENGYTTVQIRLRADFSQAAEYGFTAQSFAGKGLRIAAIAISAE